MHSDSIDLQNQEILSEHVHGDYFTRPIFTHRIHLGCDTDLYGLPLCSQDIHLAGEFLSTTPQVEVNLGN